MVTIVIPNYNRAEYLAETLHSVQRQSYTDWEAIVVDDGSTDDSKQIVESFLKEDSRFQWIERISELKGASVCRNIGIDTAKGEYIIFLDSDDLLAPHCLEQRVEIMNQNLKLDFAVFPMLLFKQVPGDDEHVWNIETEESHFTRFLKLDSVWQTTGPIWRRNALLKIGKFDPKLQCWQDIDIHLKALHFNLEYQLFLNMAVDCYYRKDAQGSISQQNMRSDMKLLSKRLLCDWVINTIGNKDKKASQILLHTLGSSINGFRFKFFVKNYFRYKKHLKSHQKNGLVKIAIINFLRLYKISIFTKYASQQKHLLFGENSIGKFKYENT